MDLIPSEMFRGHLDTIILLSLVNDDKHTNQIREEIEERSDGKFELKQGTFYSCLQRIVKQGYVTEYRATSADGVRRKFLQLTEKGKNYIDDNKDKWEISRSVVNVLLETPEEIKAKQKSPTPTQITEKPLTAQEPFDIDKALKDFLSSDDNKSVPQNAPQISEKTENCQNISSNNDTDDVIKEPILDNVTIIDFSDIADKPAVSEFKPSDEGSNSPKPFSQVNPADIPFAASDKNEKHKNDFPTTDLAKSPEEYDVLTLVGIDPDEQKAEKNQDSFVPFELPAQPEGETTKHPEEVNDVKPQSVYEPIENKPFIGEETHIADNVAEKETSKDEFSSFKNQSQFPNPQSREVSPNVNNLTEDEDDFYNGQTPILHDYKTVLGKMFQTPNKQPDEDPREIIYVQGTDINTYFSDPIKEQPNTQKDNRFNEQKEKSRTNQGAFDGHRQKTFTNPPINYNDNTSPEVSVPKADGYDFSDIQSLAKIEGFKVSISSAATKRSVNSILVNKLSLISSLMFYAFALVEILLLAYFTAPQAGLTAKPFVIFGSALAVFPLTMLVIYFIDPKRKVASIATMKSVIELCIVIMLNLILITIVFSILSEVDFARTADLLRYILYPIIIILNVPVYFIIKYLNLENQKFYK